VEKLVSENEKESEVFVVPHLGPVHDTVNVIETLLETGEPRAIAARRERTELAQTLANSGFQRRLG